MRIKLLRSYEVNGADTQCPRTRAVPLSINGCDVVTSLTFEVVHLANNEFLYRAFAVSESDVVDAINAADLAFPTWRDTASATKRDILLPASEIMEDSSFSTGFDIPLAAQILKDVAGRISTIEGSIPMLSDPRTGGLVVKEPLGLVSIAYVIAAGNTAILKAPELSPRCSWATGSVLKQAGLPSGVLNVIAHRQEDAAAITEPLTKHPSIKKINFTGSNHVDRIIGSLAGKALKPAVLELGGKAPAIVCRDADLLEAAKSCALGAFLHCGQICMSTEKILVDRYIYEDFVQELKFATQRLFPDGVRFLQSSAATTKIEDLIRDAVTHGAIILSGSLSVEKAPYGSLLLTILGNVNKEMKVYFTESFGPLVSLIPFDYEEEAVTMANDTEYGLSAAVCTGDVRKGLLIAERIESGAVHINSMTVHDETEIPHGECKARGFGRFGSHDLDEWLKTKTITCNK
ncbi:Aldehyde/histidinol dehydrogenase [Halenospora varia]|nr:Aldehyde/histidinol dehydrogenase [Halenospora varia]